MRLFDAVNKIQDTILICPAAITQAAALGALRRGASYCRGHLDGLARVRAAVLGEFTRLGDCCSLPRPGGAFYGLVRIRTDMDAMTLVERLIREHRVAVIPGTAFGLSEGCYLRVSYGALEAGTVAEGMRRLVTGIRTLAG